MIHSSPNNFARNFLTFLRQNVTDVTFTTVSCLHFAIYIAANVLSVEVSVQSSCHALIFFCYILYSA
jgi:hypothetical protein